MAQTIVQVSAIVFQLYWKSNYTGAEAVILWLTFLKERETVSSGLLPLLSQQSKNPKITLGMCQLKGGGGHAI